MDQYARRSDRQEEVSEKPPCRPQPAGIGPRLQDTRADIGEDGKSASGIKHPAERTEIGNGTIEGNYPSRQGLSMFRKAWVERNKDQNQHKACRKNPTAGNQKTSHQYSLILFLAYGFAIRKNNSPAVSLL
ncbi:hypothetical protein D3C71_1635370 [compost metagenome]